MKLEGMSSQEEVLGDTDKRNESKVNDKKTTLSMSKLVISSLEKMR